MEHMRCFRVDAATFEESMQLFRKVNEVTDRLSEAELPCSPGMVEDAMTQRGLPVTITRERDGCYLIVPKEG